MRLSTIVTLHQNFDDLESTACPSEAQEVRLRKLNRTIKSTGKGKGSMPVICMKCRKEHVVYGEKCSVCRTKQSRKRRAFS